jgi:hypothetical protein
LEALAQIKELGMDHLAEENGMTKEGKGCALPQSIPFLFLPSSGACPKVGGGRGHINEGMRIALWKKEVNRTKQIRNNNREILGDFQNFNFLYQFLRLLKLISRSQIDL